eukprot:TRINITY_DN20656_c0_g1_i1.p1 TRINITY_DN20656_c0_g1~~TRINITY_DN20656_c0_g1_i1.p1  ORF type:complete len:539 (-),score=96.67 TRINITY_DN20656_c0_g1_i1:189-1805(-)
MNRVVLPAVLTFSHLNDIAAHQCSDGSRVQCVAVQKLEGNTDGYSYDARGTPLCTPEGEQLFCLENHNYHRCSAGQAPCCRDGSDPFHHRHNSHAKKGVSYENKCRPTTPPPVEVEEEKQEKEVSEEKENQMVSDAILLDSADTTVKRHVENAVEGTFAPCLEDAYDGNFYHDMAINKGKSVMSMSFDPPESGCYSIEERHPGNNPQCSRYLPRNAKLTVDYCKGLTSNVIVDQSSRGGQWNHIGAFMFYKGSEGKITMSNSPSDECEAEHCFLVADAFRLRRLGDSCPDVVVKPEADIVESANQEKHVDEAKEWRKGLEGVMTLQMHAMANVHAESSDFMLSLNTNSKGLALVLAAHFGYTAASVLEVNLEGRRLHAEASDLKVRFALYGTSSANAPGASTEVLAEKLNTVLAQSGLQVTSAEVQWSDNTLEPNADDDERMRTLTQIAIIVGVTFAGIIGGIAGCVCFRRLYKKQHDQVKQPEIVTVKAKNDSDEASEIASVSTDDAGVARSSTVSSEPSLCDEAIMQEVAPVHAIV